MLVRILRDIFFSPGGDAEKKPAPVPAPSPAEGSAEGNPISAWFATHEDRYLSRWAHYPEIYHRHFGRYRGRSPVVLEIGTSQGGSLEMWRDYFGPGCRLYGIAADLRHEASGGDHAKVLIGDPADRGFLARVREEVPRVDVLISGGEQAMDSQIAAFEELYPHVADDGVYLCEDVHTSYWKKFGGECQGPGTFVEYSKALIDKLNAWHSHQPDKLFPDDYTFGTYAMHYYTSVLVIEKRPMAMPRNISAGKPLF